MQVLRFILGLLIAVGVLFMGLFAFVAVAVVGLIALVVQSVRRRSAAGAGPTRHDPPGRRRQEPAGAEIIDIVATESPPEQLR